jgi:GT2 family glycosyltransferase
VASQVTPRRAQISVAIATRDRPQALARCLESLKACRVLPAEVVVADQSAHPETRRVVMRADGPQLPVRWVDGGSGGLAGAQQTAFDHAACDLVAVLDDDCIADSGWIETLDRAFDEPELALVGGRVMPLPGEGVPVASRTSGVRRRFRGRSLPWNVGSGNNFALRREWFHRVGGCDGRLGPGTPGRGGGIDMDLFYRVLRAGGPALYEPGAVVWHRRAVPAGRLARRHLYGFGMGATCAIHLRAGDLYAVPMLAAWVALRLRLVAAGLLRRRLAVLHEEARVLAGTAAGMLYGIRLEARDR